MELRFNVTFKQGARTVAVVEGIHLDELAKRLTLEEVCTKVLETEQFLEKLTGHRVHIEQVS